jgi:hypothetical protein
MEEKVKEPAKAEDEATDTDKPKVEDELLTTESGVELRKRTTSEGAIEYVTVKGELHHREGDEPAIEYINGWKEWRIMGALHREGGLPARVLPEGDKEWWVNGERHRDDGPAHVAHEEPTEEELAQGITEGKLVLQRWFENGVQHREDGPGNIHYGDEDYWLQGVTVTEQIVMSPETITPEQAMTEENAEIRRIMIERMGTDRFLDGIGAKSVDMDDHEHNGLRSLMKAGEGDSAVAILVCSCPSTGRVYYMQVPAETKTCEAADVWLSGDAQGVQIGRT